MIRVSHSSADDRDLKVMTRGNGSLGRNLLFASLPAALFVFALAYLTGRSWVAASLAAILMFVVSGLSNFQFFREVRRRRESQADGGAVEVIDVQASQVVDIEPLGSHGPAWVFFASDGKALLLVGQWLLEQRSFPSASFRLYRWADTKKPIRIKPAGRRIEPQQSTAQLRPSHRFNDVEIFNATPETLQADLDKAFVKVTS